MGIGLGCVLAWPLVTKCFHERSISVISWSVLLNTTITLWCDFYSPGRPKWFPWSLEVISCQLSDFFQHRLRLPVSLHVHDMYLYLYIDIVYQYHGLLIVWQLQSFRWSDTQMSFGEVLFFANARARQILYIYTCIYIIIYIYIHTDFQCRERGRVWWHTADHVFLPTSSGPQETLKISFPTKHEQASKYTLCARGIVWHNFPLAAEMISFPWPRQSTSPETQTSSKFGNTHPSVDSPSPGL